MEILKKLLKTPVKFFEKKNVNMSHPADPKYLEQKYI